jgi:transmembrane sensor
MNPERADHAAQGRVPFPGETVEAVAARWAKRRRAGLTETERGELVEWLSANPRHAAELARVDAGRDELDWPLYSGNTDAIVAGLQRRARKRRVRRMVMAGGTAAALAIGVALFREQSVTTRNGVTPTLLVVKPHRQVLPDGTAVELMDGAEISTDYADARYRFVSLVQGTAHFEVAPDSRRPFVVKVGGVAVRAVGTAFAIELKPDTVNVVVTHGRVAVDDAAAFAESSRAPADPGRPPPREDRAIVSAGNLIVVERAAAGSPPPVPVVRPVADSELEATLGWRNPRLEFAGTALADVVKMMNRYSAGRSAVQLTIADASLGELQLSGALRADKVEALVQILESDFPIRAERRGEHEIVLRRAR